MRDISFDHQIHSLRADLLRTEYAFLLLQKAMLLEHRHFIKADDDPDGDWDDGWAYDDREKFSEHFKRHAKDFKSKNWNDYSKQAKDFYKRFQQEKLPAIRNKDGWVKVYDPKTNTLGSYNPQGQAETFFKPTSPTYYERQVVNELGKGGEVINPLPRSGGGGGLGGPAGGDPIHPNHNPWQLEE